MFVEQPSFEIAARKRREIALFLDYEFEEQLQEFSFSQFGNNSGNSLLRN